MLTALRNGRSIPRMVMTNAERQAAFRKRRAAELKRLRRVAAKIKRKPKGKTK